LDVVNDPGKFPKEDEIRAKGRRVTLIDPALQQTVYLLCIAMGALAIVAIWGLADR
jgi:hypothetical protein